MHCLAIIGTVFRQWGAHGLENGQQRTGRSEESYCMLSRLAHLLGNTGGVLVDFPDGLTEAQRTHYPLIKEYGLHYIRI